MTCFFCKSWVIKRALWDGVHSSPRTFLFCYLLEMLLGNYDTFQNHLTLYFGIAITEVIELRKMINHLFRQANFDADYSSPPVVGA